MPDTTTQPRQILCIKWGTFYGPEYVNILHSMVARNLTGPFKVYCFTDDATGVRPEVTCLPLPELGCEIPPGTWGKWRKSALWSRELPGGLTGVALFVDLDTIIVGNIDGYFTHGNPDDVILARNWVKPLRRLGQTSIFRFKIGSHPYMLDNLRADPGGISRKYQYEQHYVTHGIKTGITFWPKGWTCHFRLHCLPPFPLRYFVPPRLPKGAKIITFPGRPNPDDAATGRWYHDDNDRHRTLREHFKHVLENNRNPNRHYTKRFRDYILPTPWIHEYWRE